MHPDNYQNQAVVPPHMAHPPPLYPDPNFYQQATPQPVDNYSQQNTMTQPAAEKTPQYQSHHVYGKSGALTFQFGNYKGVPSINIDAARSAGGRNYQWDQKVTILLNDSEIPHILGVLLGMEMLFEGRHHGTQKDKWFKIENQKQPGSPGKIFMMVGQGAGNSIPVPISPEDCFFVTAHIMSHLSKRFPGLDAGQIPNLIAATSLRLSY